MFNHSGIYGWRYSDGAIENLVATVNMQKLKFEVLNEEVLAYSLAVDKIEVKLTELEIKVSYCLNPGSTPACSLQIKNVNE